MKSFKHMLFVVSTAAAAFLPYSVQAALLQNPLSESPDKFLTPQALVGRMIQGVLAIAGIVALVMFVYGGIQIIIGIGVVPGSKDSSGTNRLQAGRKTIIYAVLGLIVALGGYLLVDAVLGVLQSVVLN